MMLKLKDILPCTTLLSLLIVIAGAANLTPYTNPILSGFAPDPSCIRVDEQYFCVTSSFSAFPGIPVYTSRDLAQWKQIGNVLSRPEQLPTLATVNGSTGGIWAATIRHHNDTFWVTTTLVQDSWPALDAARWDNLIFHTKDIFANNGNDWSDPVHFNFTGYDTSLFWDDDGAVWVQGSHAYHVFPAIQQFRIDLETGKSLNGDPVTMWTGTGGLAPEGPHLYRRGDGYYLLIAEGGTGISHMVTMAYSPNITGPYTGYVSNPVLTNANTSEYLQTVGHADIFQDAAGNWWGVSLATRNATINFPMGRETILVPVVWPENEFPIFANATPGRALINMEGPLPPKRSPTNFSSSDPLVGHAQRIEFAPNTALPRQLIYYRVSSNITNAPPEHPDSLLLWGSAQNLTGPDAANGTATFIGRRQDALEFSATVGLRFDPDLTNSKTENEEAGLTLFIQRAQHFDLGVIVMPDNSTESNGNTTMQKFIRLRTVDADASPDGMSDKFSTPNLIGPLASNISAVNLRVRAINASTYEFAYALADVLPSGNFGLGTQESAWQVIGSGASLEVSGGFTGTIAGMYATGNGHNSTTPAYFSNFIYDPVLDVF